jgi:hypothetical protein
MVCSSRRCWRSSPRPSGDWAPKTTGTPTSRRRSARWMACSVPPLDGRELVQHQQHVVAGAGLAAGGEVAEVFKDQADGGVGVGAAGDGGDGEDGQIDVLQAPGAVGVAVEGAEEGGVAAAQPRHDGGVAGELLQVGLGGGIAPPELLQLAEVQAAQEVAAAAGWAGSWGAGQLDRQGPHPPVVEAATLGRPVLDGQ